MTALRPIAAAHGISRASEKQTLNGKPAYVRNRPIADIRRTCDTDHMGHNHWFSVACELAETGRYRNVAEVEKALISREPEATLSSQKVLRGMIDGICFRARRAKGWDT